MYEYAQDVVTKVRQQGRPDLFITYKCNPKWTEITNLLLPRQSDSDRYDITSIQAETQSANGLHFQI